MSETASGLVNANDPRDLQPSSALREKKALVTGASRGVGASVARQLGKLGIDVAVHYMSKGPRAQEVANELIALGRQPLLARADITNLGDLAALFNQLQVSWGCIDLLVLNASGGLEEEKPADYAMRLNLTAQVNLVLGALPLMQRGSCIVFVTSHLAHFHGAGPGLDDYEPVAASKRAGEDALREMIPTLADKGIRLVVVSGDLIEGTITPKLLELRRRGLIAKRRSAVGSLPTVEEFAAAIVSAGTADHFVSGETIYVGSTEWS